MRSKIIVTLFLVVIVHSQQQQIPQSPEPTVNFQGSFDSIDPFRKDEVSESGLWNDAKDKERQQLDMLQFSQTLGDFIPDQTFTIRLRPFEKTSFFLLTGAYLQRLRGMFHCQISMDIHQVYDQGQYIDLTFSDQQNILRQYKHQRLGVFNQPHTKKDHKYYFHFSNYKTPIDIYFSYERIKVNQKRIAKETNQPHFGNVSRGFTKVNRLLDEQQREMLRLIQIGDRHTQKIKHHLEELYWRGIAEGALLVISALSSLLMLRHQMYKQYHSLV